MWIFCMQKWMNNNATNSYICLLLFFWVIFSSCLINGLLVRAMPLQCVWNTVLGFVCLNEPWTVVQTLFQNNNNIRQQSHCLCVRFGVMHFKQKNGKYTVCVHFICCLILVRQYDNSAVNLFAFLHPFWK